MELKLNMSNIYVKWTKAGWQTTIAWNNIFYVDERASKLVEMDSLPQIRFIRSTLH